MTYDPNMILAPAAAQAPAANTAAVATLAAPTTGQSWVLAAIEWSYSAAPTGGKITIAWTDPVAGAVTKVLYIVAGGPGIIEYNEPLWFPPNALVTITLAAGGSSVTGTVYVTAYTPNVQG